MKRSIMMALLAAGIFGICSVGAGAAEQPPAAGVNNPFDKDDPQIQKLKALQWKDVNFEGQDQKTRAVAMLALNEVLTRIGGKTDARLDLLVSYFDEQKIGEAYAGQLGETPEQHPIPYDDTKKIAVAFLATPLGTQKFDDDLEGCDDNTLRAYQKLYEKSTRASYDQTIASRLHVASMGLFLQKQGKFDEFVKWAAVERQRRQEVYEKETAEKRKAYVEKMQAEKDQKAVEYAAYQARKREAEEKAASQMAAGIEYQEMDLGGAPSNDNQWYGDGYWGWTGAYYATNAYRGAVADRVQGAYRNWNGGRVGGGRGGRR